MNQHLSPSLSIKGCDFDEHPIRKNCRKSVLVQTFWNGVLKFFSLFINQMFKIGKKFQVVFNHCWKGKMLELMWTNFFDKTNTMIKQKPKGQDEATNAQLPQTVGVVAIKEMKPMPPKEMGK